jgi:hypothetical protein
MVNPQDPYGIEDKARQTMVGLLAAIDRAISTGSVAPAQARVALDLAEAYAWLAVPAQPHGGHPVNPA